MILFQPVEPATFVAAKELGGGLVNERGEVASVGASQLVFSTALGQPLQRVLANRAQHEETGLAVAGGHLAQQTLLDERPEAIEDRFLELVAGTDRLDCVEPGSTCEHGQAPEEGALVLGEKVVAPVDRAAQRLLAFGPVPRSAGEEPKAIAEPREHGLGREDVDAGSRQLDRQRQTVQAGTDLGHGRRVLVGHLEIGFDPYRSLDEERDRLVLREALGTFVEARIGRGEGWHRVFSLPVDPQSAATGRQDREPRRGCKQLCDARGGISNLLEIVEDQKRSPFAEVVGQGCHGREASAVRQAQLLRDGSGHQLRVAQQGERDEKDAVWEAISLAGTHLE